MKVRYNITVEKEDKDDVQQLVGFLKMAGEKVYDGKIISEALKMYGIKEQCKEARKKALRIIEK